MEMWELIKRLLGYANGIQSFAPAVVAGSYFRDLQALKLKQLPTADEFSEFAESISVELQDIGLIEDVNSPQGAPGILDCKHRTAFGDELYQALQGRNVIALFEGTHCEIEVGEIRRLLYQLNS
jgi:hypothetical protein